MNNNIYLCILYVYIYICALIHKQHYDMWVCLKVGATSNIWHGLLSDEALAWGSRHCHNSIESWPSNFYQDLNAWTCISASSLDANRWPNKKQPVACFFFSKCGRSSMWVVS